MVGDWLIVPVIDQWLVNNHVMVASLVIMIGQVDNHDYILI